MTKRPINHQHFLLPIKLTLPVKISIAQGSVWNNTNQQEELNVLILQPKQFDIILSIFSLLLEMLQTVLRKGKIAPPMVLCAFTQFCQPAQMLRSLAGFFFAGSSTSFWDLIFRRIKSTLNESSDLSATLLEPTKMQFNHVWYKHHWTCKQQN